LVPVAIGLVGGILLDQAVAVSMTAAAAAVLIAGVALAGARRSPIARAVALAAAAFALGTVLHGNAARRIPANHIARYASQDTVLIELTGRLIGDPVIREIDGGYFGRWMRDRMRTRLLVEAEQVEGVHGPVAVCGLVQVGVHQPVVHLADGDRVRVFGRLYRPGGPGNPGQFDWSAWSRRQGILCAMSVKSAAALSRLAGPGAGQGSLLKRLRLHLSRLLQDQISSDEDTSPLLDALVLGQRAQVSRAINEAFIRTGTVHFLSVGGTHLGMLALFVWWLAGCFGLSRPAVAAVVLCVVVAYVVIAEPCVPILRAGILYGLACIAVGIRRPTSSLNWLAAALILLLTWRPADLFAADFQLSFGIVLGIFLLYPSLRTLFHDVRSRWRGIPPELEDSPGEQTRRRRAWERVVRMAIDLLAVSVSAWLVGSVIAAVQLQRISLWGWLNTLILSPVVSFIVIWGFIKVALAALWPVTVIVTGPPLDLAARLLIRMVGWLDLLPFGSTECRPPPWWCLASLSGWLAVISLWPRWRLPWRWLGILAAVPAVCLGVWILWPVQRGGELRMWVFSVGDGQAVLMLLPSGERVVCDAGTRSGFDSGESVVAPALRDLGVRRIDHAVVSHANLDHFSALLSIDDHAGVRSLSVTPRFADGAEPGGATRFLLDEVSRRRIRVNTVHAGDRIVDSAGCTVEVLWPPERLSVGSSVNDTSLVLRVKYQGRSLLLCGDIEAEPQRRLMAAGNLRSDVLVLPHHGSVVSTTAGFISAVNPSIVIRSGGRARNAGKYPAESLTGSRRFLDTARNGAIEVTVRREGLAVRTPYGSPAPGGDADAPDAGR
jgi:competence protein ComEC